MYVYMYVCMYVYVCTYMCLCMCMYVCVYISSSNNYAYTIEVKYLAKSLTKLLKT